MKLKTKILIALVASLTLGLAPFRPEPHVWGKLKWIVNGLLGYLTSQFSMVIPYLF